MISLGMVLEQYPNHVVIYVTDPRTGVQRHLKWPPTISEVVEACDNRVAELDRNKRYANWGSSEAALLGPPREQRPTLEEMKAKYGDNWGLTPREPDKRKKFSAPTPDDLKAHYSEFGLEFSPKGEAIP
jgi:hypothetical protein